MREGFLKLKLPSWSMKSFFKSMISVAASIISDFPRRRFRVYFSAAIQSVNNAIYYPRKKNVSLDMFFYAKVCNNFVHWRCLLEKNKKVEAYIILDIAVNLQLLDYIYDKKIEKKETRLFANCLFPCSIVIIIKNRIHSTLNWPVSNGQKKLQRDYCNNRNFKKLKKFCLES